MNWGGTNATEGILAGLPATPAPGGNGISFDTVFGLLKLAGSSERYTQMRVFVRSSEIAPNTGFGDYTAVTVATAVCPDGYVIGADGECTPCPQGTYWTAAAAQPQCIPCKKGYTSTCLVTWVWSA